MNYPTAEELRIARMNEKLELSRLRSQLEVAVKGLEFYADSKKWRCSICVHEQEHVDGVCIRDCFDEPLYGGDVARECLKQIKGEKPNKPESRA